jgi:hypothetical protein
MEVSSDVMYSAGVDEPVRNNDTLAHQQQAVFVFEAFICVFILAWQPKPQAQLVAHDLLFTFLGLLPVTVRRFCTNIIHPNQTVSTKNSDNI